MKMGQGHFLVEQAKLRGAALIIGVEAVPRRQELARTYGADEIVDFSKEDVVQRILDLTGRS